MKVLKSIGEFIEKMTKATFISIGILIATVIVGFLLYLGISVAKCEILTLIHYDEFKDEYLQEEYWIPEIEKFKVISYTKNRAKVYYIEKNYDTGSLVTFVKKDGKWESKENWLKWSTVGGNADNEVWPYFWDYEKYWTMKQRQK